MYKEILGVHAHLSKCWRGIWPEAGTLDLVKANIYKTLTRIQVSCAILNMYPDFFKTFSRKFSDFFQT